MKKAVPLARLGHPSPLFAQSSQGSAGFRGTAGLFQDRARCDWLRRRPICFSLKNLTVLRRSYEPATAIFGFATSAQRRSIHDRPATTDGVQEPQATPSPPIGNLSIVFTDIVQSTRLWEEYPVATKEALAIHDDVLRKTLHMYRGYEVKSTGDGFMLAFPAATAALSWCLDVQKQLLDVKWPSQILETEQGKEVKDEEGNVLFRGLSVRMSCHWGSPVCVLNEVTGRMDYMGPIVVRAARAIERTAGGQVSVSSTFLVELEKALDRDGVEREGTQPTEGPSTGQEPQLPTIFNIAASKLMGSGIAQDATPVMTRLAARQDLEIRHLGEYELKGLSEPLQLFFVLPSELRGRLEYYNNQLSYVSSWEGLHVD
jgi:adenylate cyclase